jgi:glyoxylase-like metal-dependent hydrolase (beta-lactamase superfamily II)
MTDFNLSRRNALLGGAAALGAGSFGGLIGSGEALGKAPLAKTQAPQFYRFPVGEFQVTVVSDGPLPLGEPSSSMKNITKDEIAKALTDNFLPTDSVVLEQNLIVLNTGSRLALFDSGMGTSKMFGNTTGKLLSGLAQVGIKPAQIDDVICSHAHIDHTGGLADAKGKKFFPNATIHINKLDYDFWTDEKNISPLASKEFIAHAKQNLLPYKGRIKFIEDGKDVIPGVQAMAVPGHTVGHTIFIIKSGAKSLVYTADVTHHQILLTEKPRTEFAYDTDPKAAVVSRLKTFDMIASQKLPMLAYHFPWPGYGHLAKQGDGFRYYPEPMEFVKIPPKKA